MVLVRGLRRLQSLSAVLACIGLAVSLYLWWTKLSRSQIMCGVGECDLVNSSPYASVVGIPVAALGAAGYAALLMLAIWALVAPETAPYWLSDLRLFFAAIGLLFAAYLTGIELFVLRAI